MHSPYVIGITGAVGSGKSTVREWVGSRGASVLDADQVVHELLTGDESVVAAVVARFGEGVRSGEVIDRVALSDIVFEDAVALADLEQILHPLVVEAARRWIARVETDVAVVEAVKLVESDMHDDVDEVWVVTCDSRTRLQRLVERGWTAAEAQRRIDADSGLGQRLKQADVVIDNSGPREATARQLESAWQRVIQRSRPAPGQ